MGQKAVIHEPSAVATEVAGSMVHSLQAGEGPPLVVLHHSFGNTGWMPLHDELAEDHRVLAPDLPGFGRSERPSWVRDVRDLAVLVGLWMDAEGCAPAAVVGCGFGGWVAAELATISAARLSSLALVGAAGMRPREGRISDQMLVSHSGYVRQSFSDPANFTELFGEEFSDETLLSWDCNREMVARVAWKPYMYNRRLEPLLAEVEVPALLVWAPDDPVVPVECGGLYLACLPDARLELVQGSGHAVDIEAPGQLAALIRDHVGRKAEEAI